MNDWTNLPIGLVLLGIIVVIHELGHFLVAKLFKIKVETFSVGFGPRLLGFRYGDTDYRISAIPLGGYVKMSGENVGDAVTGAPHEFLSKPKWQRFLVASAGPAMNLILAVGVITGLFMYGAEVPEFSEGPAYVGKVQQGSAAQAAGIREGDRILSIAGSDDPTWEQVLARVVTNAGIAIPIKVSRDGQVIETSLTPVKTATDGSGDAGFRPRMRIFIGMVSSGKPAEAAGLKPKDEIVAINGTEITADTKVSELIQGQHTGTFPMTVLRNGEKKDFFVTPVIEKGIPKIGISYGEQTIVIKEGFSKAFSRSIDKNIEYGTLIFQVLHKLVTRKMDMRAVDGPIGIMRAAGDAWRFSFSAAFMLMAMISLNLGLMNLLPIPILDGGVMFLLIVEGLMGHEISMPIKERIVQVSFVFLLTLMVFVVYNDIIKSLPSSQGP